MKRKHLICIYALTALLLTGCTQQDGGNTDIISETEAKEIALEHAGLASDQVSFIRSKLDTDKGRQIYDVEFYTGKQDEYDYEIDPYTGEILDFDYDAEYH